ncbi:hypothetical protein BJX64DRAFT_287232 [Aspergillus heterothallicus]
MTSLIPRINAMLGNAEEIRNLLPQIRAAAASQTYLSHIVQQAAYFGHSETYRVVVSELFLPPRGYWHAVDKALQFAIARDDDAVVDDLITRVLDQPQSLGRNIALRLSLLQVIRAENLALVNLLVGGYEVSTDSRCSVFRRCFTTACKTEDAQIAAVVLELITRIGEAMQKATCSRSLTKQERIKRANRECLHAVADGFAIAVDNKNDALTTLILPAYLGGVPRVDKALADAIPETAFHSMSRAKCFSLNIRNQDQAIRRRLLSRLHGTNGDAEPFDFSLTAGGVEFRAHKDTLAYWSPYFAGLFKSDCKDSDHVDFDNFSPKVLEALIAFAYSGSFMKTGASLGDLKDLAEAAEYFSMAEWAQDISEWISKIEAEA